MATGNRPRAAAAVMLLLALQVCAAAARPQSSEQDDKQYGSWGTFSGLGGSVNLGGSGTLGTNVGLGVYSGAGGPAGGNQYGVNVFGSESASLNGQGAVNLGVYKGGYRNALGTFGVPGFGGPQGFGGLYGGFAPANGLPVFQG